MCVYVCVSVCECVCVCLCVCMCPSVLCVCVSLICLCLCVCVYASVCMYARGTYIFIVDLTFLNRTIFFIYFIINNATL